MTRTVLNLFKGAFRKTCSSTFNFSYISEIQILTDMDDWAKSSDDDVDEEDDEDGGKLTLLVMGPGFMFAVMVVVPGFTLLCW